MAGVSFFFRLPELLAVLPLCVERGLNGGMGLGLPVVSNSDEGWLPVIVFADICLSETPLCPTS